jgi:hypothetical protein
MSDYSRQHFRQDSDRLYRHLLNLRKLESPSVTLDYFRKLFIEGVEYPEPTVLSALHRLATSPWAEQEFAPILNRCCYILINYWWLQSDSRQATVDLVHLLHNTSPVPVNFPPAKRLRTLVKDFSATEQFSELQDRARAVDKDLHPQSDVKRQPVKDLLPRYPFLFPYCLLNWDSSETGDLAVKHLQTKKERQFEQDLLKYTTQLLRRSHGSARSATLTAVKNPTLLNDDELKIAIKQFAGKVEGPQTYRDSAKQFLIQTRQVTSYRAVKHQMYEYLTTSVKPEYGKHRFNRWLAEQLDSMLPHHDHLEPNGALLVQTCGHLLESLIASPKRTNNHFIFVDMAGNLGATATVGLLLKLVLICRDVKSHVEAMKAHVAKRFSVMLKYYGSNLRSETEWLVKCLENWLLASSIHFGQTDFSWVGILE